MRSLYSKFTLTTILIMLASGLISFWASNAYYQNELKSQNDTKIASIALEIADFIGSDEDTDLHNYFSHLGSIGYQIFIVNKNGEETYYGSGFRESNLPEEAKEMVLNGEAYHGIAAFPHKTFVTGFFANELKNTVGIPFEYRGDNYGLFIRPDIKLLFGELHSLIAWLVAGMIVLSVILVLISAKYLIRPIGKLNRATSLIAAGDFGIKLNIKRRDEIGELASSFTKMANKLQKTNEMRKEFISNISHDIQSPLSNIKGYMKLIKGGGTHEETWKNIDAVDSEIDRLSTLTRQLLLLSSIDSRADLLNVQKYDLSEQIKKVIRQYQWNLSEKGMMASYSLPKAYIVADPPLLYSVWENLLTNSIIYSSENGEVDITLVEQEEHYEILFKDNGIGMEQEELARIYDRLYRADTSRTRSIEGSGLGLAIVYSIVDLHNGKIEVISKKGEGTTFTLTLPKKL
ncbi:HAMP domain-containing histidine kinase [Bacillus sp. ISL-47]|uniref:HAMP domain-containing sensor histidine kinase n=1 Tax=Bacillus sp. ISL-47 TaxID=2819130 RepID=UPI001BE7EE69|nr:HAMP domain-containing sensor histidine kinase [Bacillus sp. ISL-47]MBT2689987.1 HAMP domain-containing histidine kinase [Bacillus sp. ISL-47]MBT2709354.1 HAMP domain-containing histidine kinase [Pseudomonas sp. ISL-84]